MPEKHVTTADNAALVWEWLHQRGGLAVWHSINPDNPGGSWTTPVNKADGSPATKPTWESANEPERIITDPDEVIVSVDREVKRFHVGVRLSGQGLLLKVTDGGTRRIRAAVEKAGEGAYHVFDFNTQEAVIMAPERQMPITEYMATKEGTPEECSIVPPKGQS